MSEPKALGDVLARVASKQPDRPREVVIDADAFDEDAARAMSAEGLAGLRADAWRRWCPQRFVDATLQDAPDSIADELIGWSRTAGPRPNLVLTGPVGTGKTHLAFAAVRSDYITRGLDVVYAPVSEMLDRLRPGGPEDALDDYVHADRVIIDDLGAERPTDWTAERLYLVVNRRWMEERPSVVTTNLEPAALREALGERTYSRLVGSDAVVLRLGGDDRRRQR